MYKKNTAQNVFVFSSKSAQQDGPTKTKASSDGLKPSGQGQVSSAKLKQEQRNETVKTEAQPHGKGVSASSFTSGKSKIKNHF